MVDSALDDTMIRRMGELFDSTVEHVERLADEVYLLHVTDGESIVVKPVPRQSLSSWSPGRPWTELVATDLLGAEGAPVPKLLAYDVQNGWLATEFIVGEKLWAIDSQAMPEAFASLVAGVKHIEDVFDRHRSHVAAFAHESPTDDRSLVLRVRRLLKREAAEAWDELVHRSRLISSDNDRPTTGPLDINAGNIVWTSPHLPASRSPRFLDMATIGRTWTERRIAAYAQSVTPERTTLLTEGAYTYYGDTFGDDSSVARLLLFDFTFWAVALGRVYAVREHRDDTTGQAAAVHWPSSSQFAADLLRMWCRPRLNLDVVDTIRQGLSDRLVHRIRGRKYTDT